MPNNHSYRHPDSGEWAHNLAANIVDDVCNTYIDPIWDSLVNMGESHLRVLEVGFGRGFNCAELIKRVAQQPQMKMSLVGLEPYPELLEPWPEPHLEWQMPWWSRAKGKYASAEEGWQLDIRHTTAQDESSYAGGLYNAFIVDLFSINKHPGHWQPPFIELMSAAAAPGAVLSSYACARIFRQQLSEHGWRPEVVRRPGWRDTLVAVFLG
ncbi:MAG: MnmC family methyltransferase [Planctomycetota bacterium]|nr:MnmC family methyltransferase [Planctomycetota bacterium]